MQLKKVEKAIKACNMAIELQPKNMKAFYRRAQALTLAKEYYDAQNDLQKCLSISPDSAALVEKELRRCASPTLPLDLQRCHLPSNCSLPTHPHARTH